MSDSHLPVRIWPAIARAVAGKCPACGRGKFFRSYLHQVENCSSCHERFGGIHADDGPAWLTINHCRPFGGTVGIVCRDSLSLASFCEHNGLAADGAGANIGCSATCKGGLHRRNLGDEGSRFRMMRLKA